MRRTTRPQVGSCFRTGGWNSYSGGAGSHLCLILTQIVKSREAVSRPSHIQARSYASSTSNSLLPDNKTANDKTHILIFLNLPQHLLRNSSNMLLIRSTASTDHHHSGQEPTDLLVTLRQGLHIPPLKHRAVIQLLVALLARVRADQSNALALIGVHRAEYGQEVTWMRAVDAEVRGVLICRAVDV